MIQGEESVSLLDAINRRDIEKTRLYSFSHKRALKRFSCSNIALVTDIETKETRMAKLMNINVKGMALIVRGEGEIDFSKVHIEVFDGENLKSFVVKGEVKYQRGQFPFSIIGVEFENISRLSVKKIEDFVETASECF